MMKRSSILVMLLLSLSLPSLGRAQDPPVFVRKWGTSGAGAGQFNGPFGLGLDGSGNVYVADTFNNRVQAFAPTGMLLQIIGSQGSAPGQLDSPDDVAVAPSGDIYVADYGNLRVSVWDATGAYLRSFATSGHPGSIAIDPQGQYVYVLLTNGHLQKFNAAGDSLLSWFATATGGMQGFGVSADGLIHISTGGQCTVRTYSPTGDLLVEWAAPGCASFNSLALDSDGNVFLTGVDGRIQELSSNGTFIVQWGSLGNGDGQFSSSVTDIVVDSQHDVYVLDGSYNRVQEFTDIPTVTRRSSWGRLKLLYR